MYGDIASCIFREMLSNQHKCFHICCKMGYCWGRYSSCILQLHLQKTKLKILKSSTLACREHINIHSRASMPILALLYHAIYIVCSVCRVWVWLSFHFFIFKKTFLFIFRPEIPLPATTSLSLSAGFIINKSSTRDV